MRVNGENEKLKERVLLIDFLMERGLQTEIIAVERNGKIIQKKEYGKTYLFDEDMLEIVTFVGGG